MKPVLVTPTQRRSFDENGKIKDTHLDFPDAVRWLAEKENIPLIDLHAMTRILYEAMGAEESKHAFVHYPANTYPGQDKPLADNTHFNPYGAYQIAKCVIEGMKQAGLPLVKYLRIMKDIILAVRMLAKLLSGMKVRLRNWKSRTVIERGFREPTSLYPESLFLPGVIPTGRLLACHSMLSILPIVYH